MSEVGQSQLQEINTVDNHHPHMSIDELLKVIKGANGMPVLFVPSSDGRLEAVAVDDLQNIVPTNRDDDGRPAGYNQKDYRSWLLLLASLVATITYTNGLAPPGGFWADDEENGHVAGTPVMRDKFPVRYTLFHYSNTTAFFSSLRVIGMLARNAVIRKGFFPVLVGICFVSLGISYITGTWVSPSRAIYAIVLFVVVLLYMLLSIGL